MKTLSLKTPNVVKSSFILEDYDTIEVLKITSRSNYYSNLLKVVSDVPFLVFKNGTLVSTTTEFIDPGPNGTAYYDIFGTQVNQIIYIKHYSLGSNGIIIRDVRVLKLAESVVAIQGNNIILEDISHLLESLTSYSTIDIELDLSKIKGGSAALFILQTSNLKFLDISKMADTFNTFTISNCYVGNINIVDYFIDKTYSNINLYSSDFVGDICDLVERYFNSNKILTFVLVVRNTEITLHNKSLIGTNSFLIVITKSGATISKGNSETGPFEEIILTYNGSTWEGSWLE